MLLKKLVLIFILSSSFCFASETKDLEKTVKKWQQIFTMNEWKVEVYPVPQIILDSLCRAKCFAASDWDAETKTGSMFILMRDGYTKDLKKKFKIKSIKADQKDSIVHEFLHSVWENMNTEYAVSLLSKALKP